MRYTISILSNGKFEPLGKVVYESGKVSLDFGDSADLKMFEEIAIGSDHYSPEDGEDYIKALELAFRRSTSISVKKEG